MSHRAGRFRSYDWQFVGSRLLCLFGLGLSFFSFIDEAQAVELRPTRLDAEAPYRRLLWVTRWDYQSPRDIEKICYNAASGRYTDILFQVRGEATTYFKSPHEPWAWQLSGIESVDAVGVTPRWDPLAVAIREGHRWGLRVHAYVNVLPCWAQKKSPPRSSRQIYAAHPEWLMVDRKGNRIKPNGFYAFVDPGLVEVRIHLARLLGRLAADYDVDGIHLDYIRYPYESGDYSYHPRVVEAFERQTGKHPKKDRDRWLRFREDQIALTIREIRDSVNAARKNVELSAAVIADPESGKKLGGQDPARWVREGLVDAVAPMVYVEDMKKFQKLIDPYTQPPLRDHAWIGIRAVGKNRILLDEILESAQENVAGVAIFSYEYLFPKHKPTRRAVNVYRTFVLDRPPTVASTGGQRDSPKPPVASIEIKRRKPRTKIRVR